MKTPQQVMATSISLALRLPYQTVLAVLVREECASWHSYQCLVGTVDNERDLFERDTSLSYYLDCMEA